MKKVDFDEYAHKYNDLLEKDTSFFSRGEHYFAKYKADIAKRVLTESPARILEFGCGTGRNIFYLRKLFPHSEIHGSDISEKSIEEAQKLNSEIYFYLENEDENVNFKYDLIFVAGVFHHINPILREGVLNSLKNRLNPDGSILIFEHNPYNPVTCSIVSNCPFDEDAVLLKPFELRSLLEKTGFYISNQEYTLFFPERLGVLSMLDRFLGWLPLGGQYFILANK